ncbi:unnamed protein product [Parnassius apollo]|uniref:(apollo) hypothetical protein n=1 Tax=Parnassius apollo TaxID=110799 RepID=A0A8S3W460_PARAO|nr:unnamed protein product [Parnassius apollo]
MGEGCEACRANINVTQKRIKCTQCSRNYHSECINFNNDTASRSEWKCPACTASCRKGGDNKLKLSLITEIKNEITSNLKQLEESHNSLLNEYNNLKSNFEKLQQNVQNGEMKLADLCAQIKKEQQWRRLSNLEIVGLPENSKESTSELIIKIASYAGIKLTDDQIVFAHRVQPMQNVGGCKLQNRTIKDNIISELRKTKGITTSDIGLGGPAKR